MGYAIHNFIVSHAMAHWKESIEIVVTECYVFMAVFLIYHGYNMLQNKKANGYYWS